MFISVRFETVLHINANMVQQPVTFQMAKRNFFAKTSRIEQRFKTFSIFLKGRVSKVKSNR